MIDLLLRDVGGGTERLYDFGRSGIGLWMDAVGVQPSYRLRVRADGRLGQGAGDAVVVAALVCAELEAWLSAGIGAKGLLSILLGAAALPLFWRRRFPLAAPLSALAILAASPLLVGTALVDSGAAIPLAILAGWTLGRRNERTQALLGLAVAYALFLGVVAGASDVAVGDVVYGSLQLVAPWVAGQALRGRDAQLGELRERTARLEGEREQRTRAAVAEERLRIARELHDVVAHSISVMTVQAGGARLLLESEPGRAEQALFRVEEIGRGALAEMRRLPTMLGRDDTRSPRASLVNLESLLDQFRGAGLPVELTLAGAVRPIPAGLDMAAYRVVQEALTNVLKHAGPATASVCVHYAPAALELEVDDDGGGTATADGGGHGLVGMRERVAIYGGELTAGANPGGGYRVRARLPLESGGL